MEHFAFIYGYALIIALFFGFTLGHLEGYYQRKYEEPRETRKLVDEWKKSR